MKRKLLLPITLVVLGGAVTFALAPAPTYVFSSESKTTGKYPNQSGCKPQGTATATTVSDPDLNRLKNRDKAPTSYMTKTVADFVHNTPTISSSYSKTKHFAAYSLQAKNELKSWTNKGAHVRGYFNRVKDEGPEACNCGNTTKDIGHDIHVWLGDFGADKSECMVVEISPRLKPTHPSWTRASIQHLIDDGTPVRVSGWIAWDHEHKEQLGVHRATLWELHPIHKIETQDSSGHWHVF